ncbi:MAG: hypothetical protein ACRD3Q_07550 [Terriglobales bacterium]
MRKFVSIVLVVLFTAAMSWAQQENQQADQQQQPDQQQQKKEKKDNKKKKDKKDKDKNSGSQDELNTEMFSQAIANDVLGQVRDGLEGHSSRLMLGAFDEDDMAGYLSFEDQVEAMFAKYDSFRVHFRINNSTIEGNKGVVLVDWEMEELPRDGAPQRRNGQIRFEMQRTKK